MPCHYTRYLALGRALWTRYRDFHYVRKDTVVLTVKDRYMHTHTWVTKRHKKNNIKVSMSHQKASVHLGIDLF